MKTCSQLGIITLKDRILPLIEQPNSCEVESGWWGRGAASSPWRGMVNANMTHT